MHLLAADDLLTERYRGRIHYFTMCGQVITSELPLAQQRKDTLHQSYVGHGIPGVGHQMPPLPVFRS